MTVTTAKCHHSHQKLDQPQAVPDVANAQALLYVSRSANKSEAIIFCGHLAQSREHF